MYFCFMFRHASIALQTPSQQMGILLVSSRATFRSSHDAYVGYGPWLGVIIHTFAQRARMNARPRSGLMATTMVTEWTLHQLSQLLVAVERPMSRVHEHVYRAAWTTVDGSCQQAHSPVRRSNLR